MRLLYIFTCFVIIVIISLTCIYLYIYAGFGRKHYCFNISDEQDILQKLIYRRAFLLGIRNSCQIDMLEGLST